MYQHHIDSFGNFKKHIIENSNGDSFTIVPAYGANLIDLKFKNKTVIDGFQTPEELKAGNWGKSILLFPFPNRLKDGKYTHRGVEYQFAINNADTQNAIHGFGFNMPFDVVKTYIGENEGAITCEYQHDGSHPAYPFKFTFQVQFTLKARELQVDMSFTNHESFEIPVGLGWHPYYRISERSDDTALQMPEVQIVAIDDRMIPTGEKQNFTDFETLKPIENNFLDNGFFIKKHNEVAEVILQSELGRLTCWQETGAGKWNFVQVFTPPHRMSIAVEPMTCNVDAFNNKDGLTLLSPNTTLGGRFGVRFSE